MENEIENFSLSFNRKLVFGKGVINLLSSVVKEFGKKVLFVVSKTFSNSQEWKNLLEKLNKELDIRLEFVSGEPTVEMVDSIVIRHKENEVDVVVSIGGGSAIDTGKAVATMLVEEGSVEEYLEGVGSKKPSGAKKPFIAVPTTFGTGSEATKNAVISKYGKFKKSLRHDNFIPDVALIDPTLGYTTPVNVRIPSGLDALTQLIEAYTSTNSNPYSDALCEKAFSILRTSFGKVLFNEGPSYEDFSNVALSAYFSGICLANAGLGVVHGFASVIGGLYSIPHGVICGKLIYHSTLKNIETLKREENTFFLRKYAKIGDLLYDGKEEGIENGLSKLKEVLENLHHKAKLKNLKDYGITESDLPLIASKTSLKENPSKLTLEDLIGILEKAM
ncbi:MAG: iron-containing alcohol dehydrogenase [Brevinematia bacterium]